MKKVLIGAFGLGVGVVLACSSTKEGFKSDQGGDGGPQFSSGNDVPDGAGDLLVTGTVYTPNGTLALANTLVYVTDTKPEPIPQQTYCDKCISLPPGSYSFSGADGSFSIPSHLQPGKHFFVVQKGQFRRVREFETTSPRGEVKIDKEFSTLPGKNDPKGDDVPKMLIFEGPERYDPIELALGKLGISEFEIQPTRELVRDAEALKKYHVILMPCGNTPGDPQAATTETRANLQGFVRSGGKLYVTDYSYEWVRQPFGGFFEWEGESVTLGSAVIEKFDGAGNAIDPGLKAWLTAVGHPTFTLEKNYTRLTAVNTLMGHDQDGKSVLTTPKVWMNVDFQGKDYPATVSFDEQCGRVLFSTYHAEAETPNFLAQEKALLYILLEIGECAGDRGVPK